MDGDLPSDEGKSGERKGKRKHHRTTGATQLIDFLKYTCIIQRNEKKTKKEEEDRKHAETMHEEQMKMLSGLTNLLGKLADAAAKK